MRPLQRIVLSFTICVLCGMFISPTVPPCRSEETDPYAELQQLADVMAIIRRNYVDEVPMKTLVDGAISGMLAALDPHSSFLTPEDYKEMQSDISGEFIGLGLDVAMQDEELIIIAPLEGSPAERAGLITGDKIIKIDDRNTGDIGNIMEVLRLLRGEKGTRVTLTIMRETFDAPKDFSVERELIKVVSVHAKTLESGYGYLRIAQFQASTATETAKELARLHKENASGLNGLIIDLRNNSGGLLDQAVNVTNLFLESGLIVYTEGRDTASQLQFSAQQRGTEPAYPLIVLINGGTASAAEIVAGALKDQGRAVLLGTKSFGKGSVQSILPLRNDYGLRLTTARYFTPLGTSIQARGITPDIIVDARQRKEVVRSDTLREEDLPHHIEATAPPEMLKKSPKRKYEERLAGDNQLQQALDILKATKILKSSGMGKG